MILITKYTKFLESIQKKDMWDVIPQSVKDLNELFKRNNKKLYLVGGAVRDFLTGDKPKDFDLATDALPDEVIDIVGKKYRTNLQGKAFGVVVVFTKEIPEGMEIATFRTDIYDDKLGISRNPNVKFTSIEEDVKRRDIPFNAMFYDLDKRKIIDLVGGLEDIENKITRFIGNPTDRIIEDPLRILRLLRFSCRYNFNIDNDTKKSIIENKDKLSIISKERIYDEFKKSWNQVKNFNNYLRYITEFDMWNQVFPSSNINTSLIKSSDFVVVLANLFKNEPLSRLEFKLVQNYKIESETAKKVIFLLSFNTLTPETAFEMFKKKEQCFITDATILEWIKVNSINDPVKIKFLEYKPSTSAEELMAKGITGRDLGIKIKELEVENFKKLL